MFLIDVISCCSFCFLSLLREMVYDIISPLMTTFSVSHKVDGDIESDLLNVKNSSIALDMSLQNSLSARRVVFNLQALRCAKF